MPNHREYTEEYLLENTIGKLRGITIPLNISVEAKQKVFEYRELSGIIQSATTLAQGECYCRKQMNNCDNPRDGCIALDEWAEKWIENGDGRAITKEEALKALKNGAEHGLVHIAYVRDRGKADVVCSCCTCCCENLNALTVFGYSDQILSSDMIAHQEEHLCTHCGACVDRCHFKARSVVNGSLHYESERCAGCGLCVSVCPTNAILMVEREGGGTKVPFP